jgi:UDP-N-acetylglucosamine transferase subunit ALG13
MIYVTIGNEESYGFKRLIEAMDLIAGEIEEEVIFQIGNTPYFPRRGKYFHYITYIESIKLFQEANLIVSHCSTGSLINARKFCKPLIVVPRRKEYGELFDEHQMELAKAIEKESYVRVVYDIKILKEEVLRILKRGKEENLIPFKKAEGIIKEIQKFLSNLSKKRR